MKTLLCTVGLPRSGKTTWAAAFSKDHGVPIVSPDAVRLAIHGQRFISNAEPFVWATAKAMAKALFIAGHDLVIVDASNGTLARRADWKSREYRTLFVVFDADKETCLQRAGDDLVIKPIIERMAAQWEPLVADEVQVTSLGATGTFSDGALDPQHDEGDLRFAIAADKEHGVVRFEFGKPVAWLGLPKMHALELAEKLRYHAGKLD